MNNKSTELPCGCPRQDEYSMCINQSHLGKPTPSESWEEAFDEAWEADFKVYPNGGANISLNKSKWKCFISEQIAKAKAEGVREGREQATRLIGIALDNAPTTGGDKWEIVDMKLKDDMEEK